MGIKGLNKLIKINSINSVKISNIRDLKGKIIAIDAELLIHKINSGKPLIKLINNVIFYLKNKIIPIYIFDGFANQAKQKNTLNRRNQIREKIQEERINIELELAEEIKKCESGIIIDGNITEIVKKLLNIRRKISFMTISKNYRNDCKKILNILGVPCINAKEDAEALCVGLCSNGYADYILSEDTDVITYSAAAISLNEKINDIKFIKMIDGLNFEEISVKKLLSDLKLSPNSFVDMCILCGCDFCDQKLGPIKSYFYIMEHNNIETVNEKTGINFLEYETAREVYYENHMPNKNQNIRIELKSKKEIIRKLGDIIPNSQILLNKLLNNYEEITSEFIKYMYQKIIENIRNYSFHSG